MQVFLSFCLIAAHRRHPVARPRYIFADGADLAREYSGWPLFEIVWALALYTFITTWVAVVVTSMLSCLFIRWTAASPGLYP